MDYFGYYWYRNKIKNFEILIVLCFKNVFIMDEFNIVEWNFMKRIWIMWFERFKYLILIYVFIELEIIDIRVKILLV